jgi:hypothetical protein
MTRVPSRRLFSLLAVLLLAMFAFTLTAAADEPMPVEDPACGSADPLLALDAECGSVNSSTQVVAAAAAAASAAQVAGSLPANCRLHAEAVFWTASDWLTLADAFAADPSPCADYYISLPPLAADKKRLRVLQDDLVRARGPRIHPVAEVTLGGQTGWAKWVADGQGSWFDAGVEFRKRMADAGYRFDLGETWFLNEFDRSTRRDEPPYSRAAMRDLVRGLYDGGGTLTPATGIVEIGIAYTHQNIPDVPQYKEETKTWLEDTAFWQDVGPKIRFLAKETYPDARFWGVAGSSRQERTEHLTQYMEHFINLAEAGPPELVGVREFLRRAYMSLGNATWPALGPDPYTPPFCCGHGWTLIPLDEMLSFVSEQVYAVRHYAGSHPQDAPAGRLGFSWQPTNNFKLPGPEWEAAKQAIAARLASAIHYAYRQGGAAPEGACAPPDSSVDWCTGGDVTGATFTDAWQIFQSWN